MANTRKGPATTPVLFTSPSGFKNPGQQSIADRKNKFLSRVNTAPQEKPGQNALTRYSSTQYQTPNESKPMIPIRVTQTMIPATQRIITIQRKATTAEMPISLKIKGNEGLGAPPSCLRITSPELMLGFDLVSHKKHLLLKNTYIQRYIYLYLRIWAGPMVYIAGISQKHKNA